jgi:benzoylformate decarboxylase
MYTCQALWTAAHERVPVTAVILDNGSYRILKQRLLALKGAAAHHDRFIGMDLDDPPIDLPGLARSLGVDAERVATPAALGAAVRRAIGRGRPGVIVATLDRGFKPV